MSELKAVHAFDVYEAYTKTGDDDAAQVYIKSEADKVIAEKLRHHKYKRCLAMALWFSAEIGVLEFFCGPKIKYYKRWQKRWLELAEKFNEAK